MSMLEDRVEIANPQHPHVATVLLLDTSGSMAGEKIAALNDGLRSFKDEVLEDDLARKRVDLAVVTFGSGAEVLSNFSSIQDFEVPTLTAGGSTPMGQAIKKGVELLEVRKQQYKAQGTDYYRPWLFLITDGAPTDIQPGTAVWDEVVRLVHDGEASKRFMFFAVVVEPGDAELLGQIAPPNRPPEKLVGTKFRELFRWLSKSQAKVSASRVGEQVTLETPANAGWGEIPV